MYLTFVIMHDTLAFFLFPENMFLGSMDYLWEDSSNLLVSAVSITYTFVISLYSSLFRLLFELAHTIFVCTAQFIAFFAISFWFFLFLADCRDDRPPQEPIEIRTSDLEHVMGVSVRPINVPLSKIYIKYTKKYI